MNYAQIRGMDIVNGDGIGVALFTQGCPIHCEGCFNKELWDFNGGKEYTIDTTIRILELMNKDYIQRLSILGGEPLVDNNIEYLSDLVCRVKELYPNKKIYLYSGYVFEELQKRSKTNEKLQHLLSHIDILIDGPYIHSKRDVTLKWRGSSNQRIIDVPASLKKKKVVLFS